MSELGARLKNARQEKGLTMGQVADQIGVSKPTVWAWEKGKSRPTAEKAELIMQTLGINIMAGVIRSPAKYLEGHLEQGAIDMMAHHDRQIELSKAISLKRIADALHDPDGHPIGGWIREIGMK